ncbi:MAG: AIR synthase-related protein [Candidatus Peregrinibacteria bacterium]
MATYQEAGVDISTGDIASRIAYQEALKTFASRAGMIGAPLALEGGFSGALDFGQFLMVMNCDGVGTKIDVALETQNFTDLGDDLLAMTADDAICVGAEVIAITNTVDTNRVNPTEIKAMMESLSTACIREKVVIPGGEIAELGHTLSKTIWNSTAIGVVEKEKYITGADIAPGDSVIALQENGFRANGFSLVRHILRENGVSFSDPYEQNLQKTWGEMLLTPAKIYHSALLSILGRYGVPSVFPIKGIAHITGGGLAGNFFRILKKKNLGAYLPDIFDMPEMMKAIQKMGNVSDREAYRTWNGGNGMLLVVNSEDAEKVVSLLKKSGVTAKVCGEITATPEIVHKNWGAEQREEMLKFTKEEGSKG